jgi:hypothetical protein
MLKMLLRGEFDAVGAEERSEFCMLSGFKGIFPGWDECEPRTFAQMFKCSG